MEEQANSVLAANQVVIAEALSIHGELARLARRATTSAPDGLSLIARELLVQLVVRCGAQRGALLIPQASSVAEVLAAYSMSEHEARGIDSVVLSADATATAVGDFLWLTCLLPLGDSEQGAARGEAQLVLGWESGRTSAVERARRLLPLLTGTAGAVAATILLAARVAALEALETDAGQSELLLHAVERARADWEQTFDAVSDPIAILTPEHRIVRANAAYARMMGVPRGECGGQTCFALQGEAAPCESCPLTRTVQSGHVGEARQTRTVGDAANREAGTHTFEIWAYPLMNGRGQVERVIEVLRDVTERERLQQVASQAEAWREADQLKSELLGTVSHELRSPLTAIKGYAATLLRHDQRLPREERREFLEAIGQASDRLQEVIDRLLEMSQLEAGAVRLERFPLDVLHLVRDAVASAEREAEDRAPGRFSFTVIREADPTETDSLDLIVRGDARRLRTVLDHLLENAVKYSPAGGTIAVTVRTFSAAGRLHGADSQDRPDDIDGPSVEVEVRDVGVGIPAEHLDRVFDRFHRVDTRLARDAEGLGLGLAIARRIVELHGGSIRAESVQDGGSAFFVRLPLDADQAE